MTKEEFIGKLQMCYFGDRNAFDEIVEEYKELINRINKSVETIDKRITYCENNNQEQFDICSLTIRQLKKIKNDLTGDTKEELKDSDKE